MKAYERKKRARLTVLESDRDIERLLAIHCQLLEKEDCLYGSFGPLA